MQGENKRQSRIMNSSFIQKILQLNVIFVKNLSVFA